MEIIYSDKKVNTVNKKSIFLAGPTPRSNLVKSWRPDAIEILNKLNFDGDVFVPERSDRNYRQSYQDQIEWELFGLNNVEIIVFWIPRDMLTMPALTTNVEFGSYLNLRPHNILYGRPDFSANNNYLDYIYERKLLNKPFNNLDTLLDATCNLINKRIAK